MANYNSNSIKILEGLEAVRKRPGMYIGSTNARGLHHLVWEILDNSIDEYLAGECNEVRLTVNRDGSMTIEDNGRGIPVDLHEKGCSTVRIIFTTLHAGGKFDNESYRVSGGLHGVGASVVNALSSWLEVEISRNGAIYKDRYENGGNPVIDLKNGMLPKVGISHHTGTKVSFMPDSEIFETIEFKSEIIKKKLKETAFLNKGLKLIYKNEIEDEYIEFFEEEGIVGYIKEINKTKDVLIDDIIYLTGKSDNVLVEVAIQYTKDYSENILSFCNNINTIEGGTHVSGFKTALTRILNQYARELGVLKEKDDNLDGRDVRNGMTAILLIQHPNPQYEGQTKTKLGNSNAKSAVDEVISIEAVKHFDRNVEVLKEILNNALKSQKLRKAEENVRNKIIGKASSLSTNGKLASCKKRNPAEIELIIVEGDSAGGSAKQGRNREIQAILPLRGKILNVEKMRVDKILENEEIATLITTLGCGFGEGYGDDFDISKLKYGKIIIMTDADVDGAHIRTLLLTFFYRYMPELIYEGNVFIGMPPLYKVAQGNNVLYLYNDTELDLINKYLSTEIGMKEIKNTIKLNKDQKKTLKKFSTKKGITIQRYKGLGEMNPEQLWDTTLNPKTRYLKQVTIEDGVMADSITNVLMGSKVPPRREFIYKEAQIADIDL